MGAKLGSLSATSSKNTMSPISAYAFNPHCFFLHLFERLAEMGGIVFFELVAERLPSFVPIVTLFLTIFKTHSRQLVLAELPPVVSHHGNSRHIVL